MRGFFGSPLSASVVGTAFAVGGLWAARWMTDIERLRPAQVAHELLAMGAGLTAGAVVIGGAAALLCRIGVSMTKVFGGFCILFMALQLTLQLHTVPSTLIWTLIGGFGGMSVLSYSMLDSMFPATIIGSANSALNGSFRIVWALRVHSRCICYYTPPTTRRRQ